MSKNDILGIFPSLSNGSLVVTSPQTATYNCIAYAADDHNRWWWPDPDGICYWPPNAQRAVRIAAFQQAFELLGYKLTARHDVEEGKEKVAIFSKNGAPSHAAKQLDSGLWSSKLGRLEDVSHSREGLQGDEYGEISIVMERKKTV